MLRDSLLQSKKDELEAVVRTRKRKLSELFFAATADIAAGRIPQHPGLSSKPVNEDEIAFLDANDITKGHFFDESSLPRRLTPRRDVLHEADPSFSNISPLRSSEAPQSASPPSRPPSGPSLATVEGQIQLAAPSSHRRTVQSVTPSLYAKHPSFAWPTNHASPFEQSIKSERGATQPDFISDVSTKVVSSDALTEALSIPVDAYSVSNRLQNVQSFENQQSTEASSVSSRKVLSVPAYNVGTFSTTQSTQAEGLQKQSEITEHLPTPNSQYKSILDKSHEDISRLPQQKVDDVGSLNTSVTEHNDPNLSPSSTAHHRSIGTSGLTPVSPDTSPENPARTADISLLPKSAYHNAEELDEKDELQSSVLPPVHIQLAGVRVASTPDAQLLLEEAQARQQPPVYRCDVLEFSKLETVASTPLEQASKLGPNLSTAAARVNSVANVCVANPNDTSSHLSKPADKLKVDMKKDSRLLPLTSEAFGIPPKSIVNHVSNADVPTKATFDHLGDGKEHEKKEAAMITSHRQTSTIAKLSTSSNPIYSDMSPTAVRRARAKERAKPSVVVSSNRVDNDSDLRKSARELQARRNDQPAVKDYFYSLFATQALPRSHSISALAQGAYKTLTTSDHFLHFREQQNSQILKRLHDLQNYKKWSLRQMVPAEQPPRRKVQWDLLLDQAKWLSTDFREERKWKMAAAKALADWCSEWVAASPAERAVLQVRARPPPPSGHVVTKSSEALQMDAEDTTRKNSVAQSPPDLVPSSEHDSFSDVEINGGTTPAPIATVVPSVLFSLTSEEVSFQMEKTPASDSILNELPLYGPARDFGVSGSEIQNLDSTSLASTPKILPVTKFAYTKFICNNPETSRKRSRFNYMNEEESSSLQQPPRSISLPPDDNNVALFMPEQTSLRARIHPGYVFRPPSNFPMPRQSFYENRYSSEWTKDDDDQLKRLVQEYSYNWSLISNCMSTSSPFSSGADRRTPWECFERWITLEGLPAGMLKTHYFRSYENKLDAAERSMLAQKHQSLNRSAPHSVRRRTVRPIRIDRRRNMKHISMFCAITKLAKKREESVLKQQRAAALATMRKANEAVQPKPPPGLDTPQRVSRAKYEQDLEMMYLKIRQQHRLAMQQAAVQQTNQTSTMSNAVYPERHNPHVNGGSLLGTSIRVNGHAHNSVLSQQLPHAPIPNLLGVNSMNRSLPPNVQIAGNGITQAQMAAEAANMHGFQRPQRQIPGHGYMEASLVHQEQQRYEQQLQQQLQQRQHLIPSLHVELSTHVTPNVIALHRTAPSVAMLAAMQSGNMLSPVPNGLNGAVSARSPSNHPHSLANGALPSVNTIVAPTQARHPHPSPEQITQMTAEQVAHNQHMVNYGGINIVSNSFNEAVYHNLTHQGAGTPITPAMPVAYTQMMRNQLPNLMQTAQARPNGSVNDGLPSRSMTPQSQRNGIQNGPMQSPRPPRT